MAGAAVLLAALLPATASAEVAPAERSPERAVISPSLQVSPELSEVRPNVPVTLTAHLSHPVITEVPVHFEAHTFGQRIHFPRQQVPVEIVRCTVPAQELTCSVSFVSHYYARRVVVRAWLDDEGAHKPDRNEGRLSSLALYPHPNADCRLEDGEPVDDSCRGGINSQLEPGAAEPDATDVVLIGWTGVASAFVDCDDASPDGDSEFEVRGVDDRTVSYYCTVTNRVTGEPVIGAALGGEIMGGPFDPDRGSGTHADFGRYDDRERRSCETTLPDGRCRFDLKIHGSGPGRVVLCLWSDGDNDGYFGPQEIDGGDCPHEAVNEADANDGTDTVQIDLVDKA